MKKFLYKIHSGFDGFTPKRIAERLQGNSLCLGWHIYIDVVDVGDEVWVYFHGPHRFEKGIYIKGIVQKIDSANQKVHLRIREYSVKNPLTDVETTRRVAEVVATRYRQVFLYPEEWIVTPRCTIHSSAESCRNHLCKECPIWQSLPLIKKDDYAKPVRLPNILSDDFTPAFWVIPSRCFLGRNVTSSVRKTSELFYRFKTGEKDLAYPLALGIYESLCKRGDLDFDCIIPIPLSPDKAEAGEIHRTRLLARELAKLLCIPTVEALSLNSPISKRRLLSWGGTRRYFEDKYYEALIVLDRIKSYKRVLLLDDVCTEGTTLRCATNRILETHPECELTAVTAGQMIVKKVVRNEDVLKS